MRYSSIWPGVLICVFVCGATSAFAQTPTSFWKFDETTGTSAVDSAGANPGTLENGVGRVEGRGARVLRFDGVNDYVTFGDPVTLEPQRFSVAVWVKRNGTQVDWARLVSKGD